jgi:hypothetical protein
MIQEIRVSPFEHRSSSSSHACFTCFLGIYPRLLVCTWVLSRLYLCTLHFPARGNLPSFPLKNQRNLRRIHTVANTHHEDTPPARLWAHHVHQTGIKPSHKKPKRPRGGQVFPPTNRGPPVVASIPTRCPVGHLSHFSVLNRFSERQVIWYNMWLRFDFIIKGLCM